MRWLQCRSFSAGEEIAPSLPPLRPHPPRYAQHPLPQCAGLSGENILAMLTCVILSENELKSSCADLIRVSTSLSLPSQGVDAHGSSPWAEGPRDMCGWPPARKDFSTYLHRRPIAVMCPAWWRGARPQALMGSVDRGLIKPAGSRCPMTRGRYPSIRRLTDDAITLLHPRKSCVSLRFFVRSA